jgi:hypothetical protein
MKGRKHMSLPWRPQWSSDHAALAPDDSLFQEALKKMRAGGSARDGGGCSNKKEQVRWCLAEATMDAGKQVLGEALCVALTRDERKGRLLITDKVARLQG